MPKSRPGLCLALALSLLVVCVCASCNSGSPSSASTPPATPSFATFDPPGSAAQSANSACDFGTYASDINISGAIVGYFYDDNQAIHGFIRFPNGTYSIVDVPTGSTTTVGSSGVSIACQAGTRLVAINNSGTTAGYATNAISSPFVSEIFTRTPAAQLNLYSNPAAIFPFGLTPVAMNDSGTVVGSFTGTDNAGHGFLFSSTGSFTQLDAPSSLQLPAQGTYPSSINANGDIVGFYIDSTGSRHGFLLQAAGTFVSLDVPPSTNGTAATGINSSGTIIGNFISDAGSQIFVRTPDGAYTVSTPPITGATVCGTLSINSAGDVIGDCIDRNFVSHAFLLHSYGTYTVIDNPDATQQPAYSTFNSAILSGTYATAINDSGAVTGYFLDSQNLRHGFLYQP